MANQFKPFRLTVNIPVDVDLDAVLEGYKLNSSIRDIRRNIGQFMREKMKGEVLVPGDEVQIPEDWEIVGSLSECDLVSLDIEEED